MTDVRRKKGTAKHHKKAVKISRAHMIALSAAVCLLLMIIGLGLNGRGGGASIKPLIDVPLTEEQTEEVVYTQGVDVSNYQGDIDWDVLQEQGVFFAYIKATEGNSWVDPRFSQNWEGASGCKGMRYGAYHFMSFRTAGTEQAESFISVVPKDKNALPPVVDIELYDEFINAPPTQEHFQQTLDPILAALEERYGKQPVIYTTTHIYNYYIAGNYDNPIWIADHSLSPALPDGNPWLFCQYTYEGQLEGYSGEEPYIDLDVFNGTPDELDKL